MRFSASGGGLSSRSSKSSKRTRHNSEGDVEDSRVEEEEEDEIRGLSINSLQAIGDDREIVEIEKNPLTHDSSVNFDQLLEGDLDLTSVKDQDIPAPLALQSRKSQHDNSNENGDNEGENHHKFFYLKIFSLFYVYFFSSFKFYFILDG